jgi:Asp-tRNA(Asn)/Glu-tRNA(Gln) amidotransferase A subunit family amidase
MDHELTWMPAWRIRELIAKREVSPVEVTEHFLARVEEHDPVLKTFAVLDADGARAQAKRAEEAVTRGEDLGPLHGIPVSVKEHIAIEGFPRFMHPGGGTASRDDLGVERLRAAGAVIFGANTMMGTGGGIPIGDGASYNWDAEGRNPWDPTRVPGWSSSGGAAAAAARLVPLAIGSDGGGSTRLPAAYCGVVGVHPTPNLIPSVSYDAPVLSSQTSSIGPLCRDVADAAIALQAMAGPDGRDYSCSQQDPPDMLGHLEAGVEDMRFAWTDNYGFTDIYAQPESARVIAAVRNASVGFTSLGASVETTDEVWEDFWQGFMAAAPVAMMPGGMMPPPSVDDWARSLDTRQKNWATFRRVFQGHDLLLTATSQLVAWKVEGWDAAWTTTKESFTHGVFGPGTYTSHTQMQNWLALPAVSVPCGFVDDLPVGLQICGPPGSEDRILRAARAFQSAFPQDAHPTVS